MASPEINLQLNLTEIDADSERIDELRRYLLNDLRELGVESVEQVTDETAPEGTKGDAFTMGALALVAIPAFLPKLVEFLQAWSLRGENRTIKIKTPKGLEVEFTPEKKLSEGELLELVDKLNKSQT